eukprot:TRINITY_DN5950_c0_g1_i2.p1 TRINITY_DN5950_c0_g1~~TRINITY_DN5950_c0_g1_i2.p1  ORF type:complete len:76 (+),score=8.75 TRINITY_DN5950_c0_g1_i2:152-379(+)
MEGKTGLERRVRFYFAKTIRKTQNGHHPPPPPRRRGRFEISSLQVQYRVYYSKVHHRQTPPHTPPHPMVTFCTEP